MVSSVGIIENLMTSGFLQSEATAALKTPHEATAVAAIIFPIFLKFIFFSHFVSILV